MRLFMIISKKFLLEMSLSGMISLLICAGCGPATPAPHEAGVQPTAAITEPAMSAASDPNSTLSTEEKVSLQPTPLVIKPETVVTSNSPFPSKTARPPARDSSAPSAVQVATTKLADKFKVSPELVTVISQGEWTVDPIPCTLDIPDRLASMLAGHTHQQIILSIKGKSYEFWAFNSKGNLPL